MIETRTFNDYVVPLCKVIEVNVQGVLCQSTESFGMSGYNYDDDDWE